MEEADIVKKLIKEKGLSQRKFAEKIDMPYSTLNSILQRGINNTGVSNAIKICKGLGITVEELEEMAGKNTTKVNRPSTIAAHGAEDLTREELKEVEQYIEYLMSKRNNKQ